MSESVPCFVSVIVATYNQGGFLPNCLNSLICQTMQDEFYEIVVVNDGSTDNTARVISEYEPHLKKVLVHSERKGLAAACKSGLKEASGDYIIRVDSDDWLDAKALEQLTMTIELNQRPEIIIPDYWVVKGKKMTVARPDIKNVFTWMAGGPLLRRDVVLKVGGYRDLFWEEYDLYIRMLSQGARVVRVEVPVLYHREHTRSMTAHREARVRGWKELVDAWTLNTLRKFGFHRDLTNKL